MRNSRKLISVIEKCSDDYNFNIRKVELELHSNGKNSIRWDVYGDDLSVEDHFYINGLFQESRLKRIAEKARQYFDSKGISAHTCSSTSCDDSF